MYRHFQQKTRFTVFIKAIYKNSAKVSIFSKERYLFIRFSSNLMVLYVLFSFFVYFLQASVFSTYNNERIYKNNKVFSIFSPSSLVIVREIERIYYFHEVFSILGCRKTLETMKISKNTISSSTHLKEIHNRTG